MAEEAVEETTEFEDAFQEIADEKDGIEAAAVEEPTEDPLEEEPAAAAAEEEPGDEPQETVEYQKGDLYYGWPQAAIDAHKEQQDKIGGLEHRINSDSGRVSAFQRKVNDLERTIADIQATGAGAQPSNDEITAAMGSDEKWDQFKEDYPEVAEAIDSRFEKVIGAQNESVHKAIEPVVQRQAEDDMEAAYDVVAQDFPTWQDAVQEQHFQDWLETQPPGIRALADSDDTADASSLIGLYDGFRVEEGMDSLRVSSDPDNNGGVEETGSTRVAERRQQQLESGSSVPSKAAKIDTTADTGDDFERAFNAYAQRKEAARQTA